MNELQTFSNSEFGAIRTIMIEEAPWFVGKDVATALGYKDTADAISRHVDIEDKRLVKVGEIPTLKTGNFGAHIINESGLYSLILSSKLPNAKKFKRWVTSEVLPAIRKTGSYSIEPVELTERITTKDDYIRAAGIVGSCRNERLPYVLSILAKAGLDIEQTPAIVNIADGECARLINKAVNDYGLSMTTIARLVGLQTTQISRIRSGESTPSAQRSKVICDAIRARLPEIE